MEGGGRWTKVESFRGAPGDLSFALSFDLSFGLSDRAKCLERGVFGRS